MKNHRALSILVALAAAAAAAVPALAQETLMYDDGVPAGYFSTVTGDIEAVAFTPAHPCRVTAVRFRFMGAPAPTDVVIWRDYAGGWPDWEGEPLYRTTVTPVVDGWTEVPVPEGLVEIDPPANFYAGQVLATGGLHVAVDASPPEGGRYRSLLRTGGSTWLDWYVSDGGDFLVRADVEYFNIVEKRGFTDVTVEAGLEGVSPSRVAWGDFDGDGDDDLLVNGARLYRNEAGTFTDVSIEAQILDADGAVRCGGQGGVWADYDNDGCLDFYSISSGFVPLCETGTDGDWYCNRFSGGAIPQCLDGYCLNAADPWPQHDCLFHNEGDGTFGVAPEEGSPYDFSPSEGAAWGDFDNDGFVDLYVANYEQPTWWSGADRLGMGTPDILWHNNGDGTFTDVSDTALPGPCRRGSGRGVNWGDYNGDGLIDIFVSVYRLQPNCLWNNNGDGTFTDVAQEAGVQGIVQSGSYGHTIGSEWMDYDNDGDLDLFSANLAHPRFISVSDKSMLLRSSGPPDFVFTDVREESGIIYQETHSEPAWGDYDNDTYPDLYITDVYVGQLSELYRQLPGHAFEDATYPTGTAVDNGWGAAWSDYDGDGDLDLVTRSLFRNELDNGNHWLEVHLEGTLSNRAAIGARVDVSCGGMRLSRQVEGGKGTTNQSSLTLHFGLGDCALAEGLTVTWPSGLVEALAGVDADRRLDLVEGSVTPEEEEEEPAAEEPPEEERDGAADAPGGDEFWIEGGGLSCGCAAAR
jgi:hypothetical protein